MVASAIYMIITRNYGTPFKNSLTLEQIEIKRQSAQERYNVFMVGMIIGGLVSLKVEFKPS